MACVPQLLAAALAAAAPSGGAPGPAIYTSPLPACDGLGLADEDGQIAALELMRDGEPLTPAAGFDTRDCRPPDRKAPAIVDCNDVATSVWVHEMIGTCDMPAVRWHASLRAVPRERSRPAGPSLCAGASCGSDPVPLRTAARGVGDTPWLVLEPMAPHYPSPAGSLGAAADPQPDSALLDRWLRPPIA